MKKRDAKIVALEYAARAIKSFLDIDYIRQHFSDQDSDKIEKELRLIKSKLQVRAEILTNRDVEKWIAEQSEETVNKGEK